MPERENETAPIRQSVVVDCPIDETFALFTGRLAEWWPLASHSICGEDADTCAMEPWVGGRVYERTRSGEEREWGTVIRWNPPHGVTFTWHPDSRYDQEQTVDVAFMVEADGTRVTLTHRGWQQAGVAPSQTALCFGRFVSEQTLVNA